MHDDGIVEAVAPRRQRVQLADEAERLLARHLHEALAARVQERVVSAGGIATTRQVTPTAPRIDSSTPLPRKNEAGSPARRQAAPPRRPRMTAPNVHGSRGSFWPSTGW